MGRILLVFCVLHCSMLFSNTELLEKEGIQIQRNYNPNFRGKKIAILTMIVSERQQQSDEIQDYQKIVAFGTRSKEIYAKKHGYDLIIATRKLQDCYQIPPKRHLECAWTRLALMSRVLSDYDWVFWSDADSIILNFDIPLEDFINDQFDVIACNRQNRLFEPTVYNNIGQINYGEVFYKNSSFCRRLIMSAWKLNNRHPQSSYDKLMGIVFKNPKYWNHILVFPYTAFNQKHALFQDGDFIVHFSKIHGERLYGIFQDYAARYQALFDRIENDLSH